MDSCGPQWAVTLFICFHLCLNQQMDGQVFKVHFPKFMRQWSYWDERHLVSQYVVVMTDLGFSCTLKTHRIWLCVSKYEKQFSSFNIFTKFFMNTERYTRKTFTQVDHCDLSSKCLTCSQLMQLSRRVTGSCVNECTHAWFSTLCKESSQHFPSDRTCLPWPPLLRLSVNKGGFCWSQTHHLWRGWRDLDERCKNGRREVEI